MESLYEIKEDGKSHILGRVRDRKIHYDFEAILKYLEWKGQSRYGQKFVLDPIDKSTVFNLCAYTVADKELCEKLGLDLRKGIFLSGPVGCGKTALIQLLRNLIPHRKTYQVIPARNIVFAFNHLGYKIIADYGNAGPICLDDIGVEPTGKFFGRDCNVVGEILISRYDRYPPRIPLTHITTNLNADEIEERYGSRVRSRMRQMFNLIAFPGDSKDKRM
ncbi:MAG: ATPase [Bacteroidota bacterium]